MASESPSPTRLRRAAAATLGAVMAGHMLLETANDALFLANVAVERLPFMTIAIAFLALGIARLDGGQSHRRVLGILQLTAVAGTLALWSLVSTGLTPVFYALYVWSGIITSLIVVRFWLLLGDVFTISEAKRVFASIAMGGSTGAVVGSLIAVSTAPILGGPGLLVLSAACYATSGVGWFLLDGSDAPASPGLPEAGARVSWWESAKGLARDPYAVRVSLLVMTGGMTLSVADYLFKSVIAAEIPPDQLAAWLSRVYLGLNVLSIGLLAIGVTPLLRRLGIDRSLAVMPTLFAVAAAGVLAGATLVSTIGMKLADGALRYSLHKTSTELLFLPMSSTVRRIVKSAIDLVGTTGAKALGSLLILAIVTRPDPQPLVAGALLILALGWIAQALALRQTYLNVFRRTLVEGSIETRLDHPELDLQSAGSLLRALSDPAPARALAALQLLSERGQSDLIPNLVLYHPAPEVVSAALDVLTRDGRDDLGHLLPVLTEHEDANVRAAAVRARWALERNVDAMRAFDASQCLVVRLSALAGLLSVGEVSQERFASVLREALVYPEANARLAAAHAAGLHYDPVYREVLVELARDPDPAVAHAAVRAIRASEDDWFVPQLVDLLVVRGIRGDVRRALVARGPLAIDALAARLGCAETPVNVQAQIPRTLARFHSREAAEKLITSLTRVESGLVRFRILAALEPLLDGRGTGDEGAPDLRAVLDLTPLQSEFDRTLARAQEMWDTEEGLTTAQAGHPSHRTVGGELLVDVLRDKRALAVDRLFRLLELLHPSEDFRSIEEGLRTGDATERSAAEEIVETVLPADVARALLAVTRGEASMPTGRASVAGFDAHYAGLLEQVLDDASATLRAVALYHAEEIAGVEIAPSEASEASARLTGAAQVVARSRERGLAAIRELFEGDAASAREASG